MAIKELKKIGAQKKVFDKGKIALVPDHFAPNKDICSANLCKVMREFAYENNIENYFEVGQMGIEHALLPEKGLVVPGDLVIGADSHTCTYGALGAFSTGVGSTDLAAAIITGQVWLKVPESIKIIYKGKLKRWVTGKDLILYTIGQIGVDGALYKAMEFSGEAVKALSIDERFTMANMAVEAGAKNGIMEIDKKTVEYVDKRAKKPYTIYNSDEDAAYTNVYEYDVKTIEPQVALPHLPENVVPVRDIENITIDQAVIGSCTNGRMKDLRDAAVVLKGNKVHPYTRLIIIPATQSIYLQALKEGLRDIY